MALIIKPGQDTTPTTTVPGVKIMDILTPNGTIHVEYSRHTLKLSDVKALFNKHRKEGYVALSQGEKLTEFDPNADDVIMFRPLQGG